MKIDDTSNYTTLRNTGVMWNYGKEIWCNLPGRYVALVADYQGAGETPSEVSICNIGIMGTEYERKTSLTDSEVTV